VTIAVGRYTREVPVSAIPVIGDELKVPDPTPYPEDVKVQ
jgi:hypothetical protein